MDEMDKELENKMREIKANRSKLKAALKEQDEKLKELNKMHTRPSSGRP